MTGERLVFDIETNGLLGSLDRVHCLVVGDPDTGSRDAYHGESLIDGLERLQNADTISGHNIIDFDIPAIQKVYPWFNPRGTIRDTLVISRLIWPDIKERDFRNRNRKVRYELPTKLIGRHSLEAWGYRLGYHKGDYKKEMEAKGLDPWAEFNPEMLAYCENDVDLNMELCRLIERKDYDERAIDLEHRVFIICRDQMTFGCSFDKEAATDLYAELTAERARLERELKETFDPWYVSEGEFMPKRTNRKSGYVEGCPLTKVKLVEFNPASRDHIANRLMAVHGWKPKQFTDSGKPKVDEAVLSELKYPEAKLLTRYLLVQKRLGQVAEGKAGWLKLEKEGRIYGRINTNGTVTGRASHQYPNLAQVPAIRSPWGKECRALFRATPGWAFVGADAAGLELRCLAHYMARWDDGEYADIILNGDIHTHNQHAAGLDERDQAKTFISMG